MHSNRKKRSIVIALVAALALSAGAYAYWTQSGSGTGSASTGSGTGITVNQTSVVSDLSPGSTPQALSGTFTNLNAGTVQVASVTATLASVTGGAGGTPECTIADYQINNPTTTTISGGGVIASGTGVGSWSGPTIQMLDSGTNQDACKGATVNVSYSSN
jgi:hypothetical protein